MMAIMMMLVKVRVKKARMCAHAACSGFLWMLRAAGNIGGGTKLRTFDTEVPCVAARAGSRDKVASYYRNIFSCGEIHFRKVFRNHAADGI